MATRRHRSYADAVRDALARLEAAGIRWYLTGSEALCAYADPRQTADSDVVVDLPADVFERVFAPFEDAFAVARPIRTPGRWLASLVSLDGWGKVDIVMRDDDPWGRAALDRRRRFDHPGYGSVWLSSPEDLLLAKLEWSEGTSELQLRDCAALVRANPGLDQDYLERHAAHWAWPTSWPGSAAMRPDPGRAELAAARRDWMAAERLALAAELCDRAFDLAWAALREHEAAAGRLDDLERARLVLSRLYPELTGRPLAEIMETLASRQARGTWHGFTPPASFLRAGGTL